MVNQLFRDSFVGRVIYHASGHKVFTHPEEQPGYVIPDRYLAGSGSSATSKELGTRASSVRSSRRGSDQASKDPLDPVDLEKTLETAPVDTNVAVKEHKHNSAEGLIYVDWDGEDDPENPYNWPLWQKVVFASEIGFLTSAVYMGSAIYTPGIDGLMEDLGAGYTGAIAGLSMFVFGYGIGPMILSPMSEHPVLGRTYIYIVALFLFVIFQIPTALATNLPGFLILRFLAGFAASPALATGGASLGDVISIPHMPSGLGIWGLGAICGPFLGPLIGAALVNAASWRWVFWFLFILGAFALAVLALFLPETSQATLLHRKAKRLRALTGNPNIVAKEAYEASLKPLREIVIETLWRPIEISLFEPMVLFVNIHIALLYAIMYLWFESFPIVFEQIHGFTLVEEGAAFLGMMFGAWLGLAIYLWYIRSRFTVPILNGTMVEPEVFLPPNLVASIALPIGLFIFAWTSTANVHWIVPIVGTFIFGPSCLMLFQTHLNYLGFAFPEHMASVYAGNDLFRSCVGASFPLFANALYKHTATEKFPVGWGVSIMAFIATAMIGIPIVFLWKGKYLRVSSKRGQ